METRSRSDNADGSSCFFLERLMDDPTEVKAAECHKIAYLDWTAATMLKTPVEVHVVADKAEHCNIE